MVVLQDEVPATMDSNYEKLVRIGHQLLEAWEIAETPLKRMLEFSYVLGIYDTKDSDEVIYDNILSTTRVMKAQNELKNLKEEIGRNIKNKYHKKKEKLMTLIAENHLSNNEVGFDPEKKVSYADYSQENCELNKKIKIAKQLAEGRKEMIFRIEFAKQVVHEDEIPVENIKDIIERARYVVDKLKSTTTEEIKYDGVDVYELLRRLEETLTENKFAREEKSEDATRQN